MLAVISPAKTLDFESTCPPHRVTESDYLEPAGELVAILRRKKRVELQELMAISPGLAELNFKRFKDWSVPFTQDNARAALFAFKGDVYTGFTLESYSKADLQFAQAHLRILSGLYGLLRPLDLILPYRLEMGTALRTPKGKNLYEFWGSRLTDGLNAALANSGSGVLINLASQEYFAAVSPGRVNGRIITPQFKDLKNGNYKIISFFAKKARGMMCDFIIKNRIHEPEALKSFDTGGYRLNPAMSASDTWVFTRD